MIPDLAPAAATALRLGVSTSAGSEDLRQRAADGGAWGAALFGALFALSFCPVSAALFFGSLVPLALQHGSKVVLPVVYGFGTALPVALLALVATGGTKALAAAMKTVGAVEVWARRITGIVFLAVGTYLSVRFVFLSGRALRGLPFGALARVDQRREPARHSPHPSDGVRSASAAPSSRTSSRTGRATSSSSCARSGDGCPDGLRRDSRRLPGLVLGFPIPFRRPVTIPAT